MFPLKCSLENLHILGLGPGLTLHANKPSETNPTHPGFVYPKNVIRDTPQGQQRLLQRSSALAFQTDLKQ